QAHAGVVPGVAYLGERVRYRGYVIAGGPTAVKWLPPDKDPDLTWGTPRAWRARVPGAAGETLLVEIPLQAFRLGTVVIQGLALQDAAGGQIGRLPAVRLEIVPVLTAADSNADLKPARGPLLAPWYERVPWAWVAAGLAAI